MDFSESGELEKILVDLRSAKHLNEIDRMLMHSPDANIEPEGLGLDGLDDEGGDGGDGPGQSQQQEANNDSKPDAKALPKPVLEPSVVFEKENVGARRPSHKRGSSLAMLLGDMNRQPPGNAITIKVFVTSGGVKHRLRVEIAPTCTIANAINLTLLQYKAEKLHPPLPTGSEYMMKVAEDDGSLDEDVPMSLEEQAQVSQIGLDTFALIETKRGTMQPVLPQAKDKDNTVLKVKLPDGSHQIYECPLDMKLKDLLRKVGERSHFDITHFHFHLPNANTHSVLDPSLQVRALHSDHIVLSRKPDAPPSAGSREDMDNADNQAVAFNFFWTEITASQYKEFLVTKINKWGQKQERVMGIDREFITNNLPTKAATTFLGIQKTTQHASRRIDQVENVQQLGGPTHFRIVFRDGFDLVPTDYIAATDADCAEIVSKIKFLRSLLPSAKSAP